MEELGEGLKELKGMETPYEEQQYSELPETMPPTKEHRGVCPRSLAHM